MVYTAAPMVAIVHNKRDALCCSFDNQDMSEHNLQSIDPSRAKNRVFAQVQSSLPGPCDPPLLSYDLLIESSSGDSRYQEPIAHPHTKGFHLLV
jgi:hypothetical protein